MWRPLDESDEEPARVARRFYRGETMNRFLPGVVAAGLLAGTVSWAAPAESLFVNANPGTAYGNRTFTSVVWGDGYPLASLQFNTDTGVVFSAGLGGGPAQRIANNGLAPNTSNNDQPDFILVYTNTLRLNALIADTGTLSAVYSFSSPMTLVDVILCDIDDGDRAVISATGPGGSVIAPSNFVLIAEGDLSLTTNAGGRPPLEPATPPSWNPATGELAAQVAWNENRSYTILRIPEGVAVDTITITFTGVHPDSDGPAGSGLGSHVYVNLWATPRPEHIAAAATNPLTWHIPTLPGIAYALETSADLDAWSVMNTVTGPAAPVARLIWTNFSGAASGFYRYRRMAP
jgi:hypothetical protein